MPAELCVPAGLPRSGYESISRNASACIGVISVNRSKVPPDASETMRYVVRLRFASSRSNVFLLAPSGWEGANPAGLWLAKDGRRSSQALIVRCALDFSGESVEKSVRFAPYRANY